MRTFKSPYFAPVGRGCKIKVGMVFAIEPMIRVGGYLLTTDSTNGWPVRTEDGGLEHAIVITVNGPISLTEQY